MKLKMINASVVLLGQGFNPSLFSYESARSAKIIKKGWELVQQPITTATLSLLRFNNNLSILVDLAKAQVVIDNPPRNLDDTVLADVAESVSRRLFSARQTAVGFNIAAIIELEDATAYLRDKFLKTDILDIGELNALGITFSYPRMDAVLNLSYNSGEAHFEGDDKNYEGIVVTANYHVEFGAEHLTLDSAVKKAKQQIARINDRYNDFHTLMPQIFEMEDENNGSN